LSREWRHYDGDDIDYDDDGGGDDGDVDVDVDIDISITDIDPDIDVGSCNEGHDGDADGAEEILSRSLSSVRLLRQRQHAHIRPGRQKPAAR